MYWCLGRVRAIVLWMHVCGECDTPLVVPISRRSRVRVVGRGRAGMSVVAVGRAVSVCWCMGGLASYWE